MKAGWRSSSSSRVTRQVRENSSPRSTSSIAGSLITKHWDQSKDSPAASDFAYMEGTNYHVRRTITTNPCPQPDDANAAQRQQFKGERAVKAGRGFVPAGANGETQAGERVSWRKHKMMAGGRGLGPGAVSPRWCEGMEAQSQVRQFPVEFQADYFPGSNAGGSIPKFIATYVRSCCCRSTWNVASRF